MEENNVNVEHVSEPQIMSQEEIQKKKYDELVAEIKAKSAEELVAYLKDKHRSDTYLVIRDMITPKQLRELKESMELYKEFQVIKEESKKSWDHDHRTAIMHDVDVACTNLYGVLLKVFKAHYDELNTMFEDMSNKIETLERELTKANSKCIAVAEPTETAEGGNNDSLEDEQGRP